MANQTKRSKSHFWNSYQRGDYFFFDFNILFQTRFSILARTILHFTAPPRANGSTYPIPVCPLSFACTAQPQGCTQIDYPLCVLKNGGVSECYTGETYLYMGYNCLCYCIIGSDIIFLLKF